jgi:hypothetical protein
MPGVSEEYIRERATQLAKQARQYPYCAAPCATGFVCSPNGRAQQGRLELAAFARQKEQGILQIGE